MSFSKGLPILAALVLSLPVNAADSADPKTVEMNLMMEASGKMLGVINAQLEGDTGKLEKAAAETVALYDQIISANPTNVKALNARGTVKTTVRKGDGDVDFMKAIEVTTSAIASNNKDADAYHDRAAAYRGLKKYDEARADYNKAIELNPAKTHWGTELKAMEIEK